MTPMKGPVSQLFEHYYDIVGGTSTVHILPTSVSVVSPICDGTVIYFSCRTYSLRFPPRIEAICRLIGTVSLSIV